MTIKKSSLVVGFLVILYLATRLVNLSVLPVFADEAIYIRWAQLMNQDFARYALFPIQDGKPPLHMLILRYFLHLFPLDPLLSSRIMSGLAGGISAILMYWIVREIGGSKKSGYISVLLYILLPFSLFHDRMGLIDSLLVMWLSMTFLGFLKLLKEGGFVWTLISGLSLGAAFYTKTPAFFFIPIIILMYGYGYFTNKKRVKGKLANYAIAGVMGILIFLTLRFSPSFPSLLSRSEDFTFSVQELLAGRWSHIPGNIEKLLRWLSIYMTLPLSVLILVAPVFMRQEMQKNKGLYMLVVYGFIFSLPLLLLGKVLASRYFLPVIIFLIPLGGIVLDALLKKYKRLGLAVTGLVILLALIFDMTLITSPEKAIFAKEDTEQYLTAWSSGYGIPETVDFIKDKAEEGRVVVATEGYFGTLPDGLLMYFDKSPLIVNLEIFGIGQPVNEIPEDLYEKAAEDEVYLLVNEHRWNVDTDQCCELIEAYPRPQNGPSLLLMKLKERSEI